MANPTPVCLVADTVDIHHGHTVENRKLEFTEQRYLKAATAALNAKGHNVLHLESPKALVDQADRVADHVVVSFGRAKTIDRAALWCHQHVKA